MRDPATRQHINVLKKKQEAPPEAPWVARRDKERVAPGGSMREFADTLCVQVNDPRMGAAIKEMMREVDVDVRGEEGEEESCTSKDVVDVIWVYFYGM
jgi:hypothetical protein